MGTPGATTTATTGVTDKEAAGRVMSRSTRFLDVLIEGGILALLLFAPLPYGAVDLWAVSVVEAGVLVLVVLTGIRMLVEGEITLRRTPVLWPGLVMVALGLLQLAVGSSVNAHATRVSVQLCAAYVGFLLVLTTHLVTPARVRRLLWSVVLAGGLLAALGIANRVGGRMLTPWFPPDFPEERLISTFVNPNHQALYFVIVLFIAAGLLLRPRSNRRPASPQPIARGYMPSVGRAARILCLLAVITGAAVALVLTFSRGGFGGLAAGLVVLLVTILRGRSLATAAVAGGAALVALAVVVQFAGATWLVERFSTLGREPFADYRFAVWERTIQMVGDAPALGVGLGAYQDAFPRYRPPGIVPDKVIDYAHNDYVQLAAEVGIPGLLVLGWAMAALASLVVRRLGTRHDPFVRGLAAGGLAALTAVAVHSALDFGLHMPANALLVVVLAAALPNIVALRTRVGSESGVDLAAWTWWATPRIRAIGAGVLAASLVLGLLAVIRPAVADWHVQQALRLAGGDVRAQGVVPTADLAAAQAELVRAAALDPGSPLVHLGLADVAEQLGLRVWHFGIGVDGRRVAPGLDARLAASQPHFATAYVAYERTLALNPRGAREHDRFGRFLGMLESVRQAVRGTSTLRTPIDPRLVAVIDSADSLRPRALTHMRTGVQLDPMNPYRHRNVGTFALAHLQDPARAQVAAESFRAALAIEPRLLDEIVAQIETTSRSYELLIASMPKRDDVWLRLAERFDRERRRQVSAAAFEEALSLAPDRTRQAAVRVSYAAALVRWGDPRTALDHAREALVAVPKNYRAFATLGDVYEALGQWDRAAEALGSAVLLARDAGEFSFMNWQRSRLAWFLERRGQFREALPVLRQMVADTPNEPVWRLDLARVIERTDGWSEALPEYRTALRLARGNRDVRRAVAEAFASHGLLQEAVGIYEESMPAGLDPAHADVRMRLAETYRRLGQPDRAADQYRQVLRFAPDHQGARNALGALSAAATPPSRP
jgi:tetratricopeptide (TPR) repeat protein/O-antigen ligase